MGHETFSYQITKDGTIRIFWEGHCVKTLGGKRGEKLPARRGAGRGAGAASAGYREFQAGE